MANMSYCRFQNTLEDLRACYDVIKEDDFEDMSQEEKKAKAELIGLCGNIFYYDADQNECVE